MKKLLVLLLTVFALNSCEEDTTIIDATTEKKLPKVDVCHYDADTDTWKTISINENALKAHLKHGDRIGGCREGYTYVPDDAFETRLVELGYDMLPLDDYVLTANIEGVTHLVITKLGIYDLTGIEDFKSLESLAVSDNNLTSLDLSNNKALKILTAYRNSLIEIDVSNSKDLHWLQVNDNSLTELDVSKNTNLLVLVCNRNLLTELDLSNNNINEVYCSNNSLTKLYINYVGRLWCSSNLLTELDLSTSSSMEILSCKNNSLTCIKGSLTNPHLLLSIDPDAYLSLDCDY